MADFALTAHQIQCVDDYLSYDANRRAITPRAMTAIVQAIPNLDHRMQALAERRAFHRRAAPADGTRPATAGVAV